MDVVKTEDDRGNPVFTLSTGKAKAKYIVSKANNGFPFFDIKLSTGPTPKNLIGSFTTPEKALNAVKAYVRNLKKSPAVRRDENTAEREERKNARKLQPDDS